MLTETVGRMPAASASDAIAEAAAHLAAGDAEAALGALRRAAEADADSLRLRFLTGLIAWRLADLQQALTMLRACHDEAPMNGAVAEVLASLYAQAGDLSESLYFGKLSTALGPVADFSELMPPSFPSFGAAFLAIRERPLFARAKLLASAGQPIEGLDLARQHVALNPADDEARRFLGEGLLRAGGAAAAAGVLAPIATGVGATPAAMSLYARALASVGERAEARDLHEQACTVAPDDAGIAAARLADALWIEDDPARIDAWIADWVKRFCPPRKPAARAPASKKLIIGYALSALADPRDAAAIAAVARAHDRSRTTVIGYGIGAQSWRENTVFGGAVDKWRDVAGLDPATLSRILGSDGLSVVIDCGGAAAPRQLMAIARLGCGIRVSWLGQPGALGAPIYDAALGRAGALPSWGPDAAYPLVRDWVRPIERTPSAVLRFGSDAGLNQLDAQTVALWSAVLRGSPEAVLLLRANDMAPGTNIDRLVARFGRDLAARIDIVDAATSEALYRGVDVALAPAKGGSPRMAAEAIACGVPVVALDAGGIYGAFLRRLGLSGSLVAADERDYHSIALGLAGSADAREQVVAEVAEVARSGPATARRIAEIIETDAAAAARASGDLLP